MATTDPIDELVERLSEVNKIIKTLDESIRRPAFELFVPFITGTPGEKSPGSQILGESASSLAGLVQAHPDAAPHENVYLVLAHWYAQYGTEPFTLEQIREIGSNAGLVLPERLDMTLKQAKTEGRNIFQSASRGRYRPTVVGEIWFKSEYGVTKGNKKPVEIAK